MSLFSALIGVGFFPGLPVRIPYSPGMEHWWDIFWWALQIGTMAYLLVFFRKSADQVDSRFNPKNPNHSKKDKNR